MVSIYREYRAARINEIVNHPSVHPWVAADDQPLDVTPLIADRRNVLLMAEHGGMLFGLGFPGVYEIHTQILPEGRGPWGLEFVGECLKWMFTHTDAIELFTRVPDGNRLAKAMTVAMGGVREFRREDGWKKNGRTIGCDVYALQMKDWVRKAPGLEERGQELHRQFEELGILDPEHRDVETHNRYAGLAAELIEGNQPFKAAWWYNAWATKAGFGLLNIESTNPIIFSVNGVTFEYDGRDLKVIACP